MLRREFILGTLSISFLPEISFASSKTLIVNRTESCGCCGVWVERMNRAGFQTQVNFVDNQTLETIKTQLGTPDPN